MFHFFESICIRNSTGQKLKLHQNRINETMKKFYKKYLVIDLNSVVSKFNFHKLKVYKLKIHYSNKLEKIYLEEYIPKIHQVFRMVNIYENIYQYKFQNRKNITQYLKKNGEEIIFILNNQPTDTSYSNLIFKQNTKWFVSDKYLLNGIQRRFLIQNNQIKKKKLL